MANINNVKLDIKKGRTHSTVKVAYTVCFTPCEVKAGFYFTDYAHLYADDPGTNDDRLMLVGKVSCYKATKDCIKRSFTRSVNNNLLDEDKSFLGLFAKKDEIYAKACVKPVTPKESCVRSRTYSEFFD